jgi:CubicO group peptidase (beta-lactamase class C family)
MNSTFVYDRKIIKTISDMALSYKIGRRYISPINNDIKDDIYGDKGVYSTIDDLYKWDKALYENILVKETTISEAYEATTLDNNKTRDYGYGWRIKNDKGIKIIYHNGWWHGYKTSITRFIEDKNTIILLNNTNSHIQGIIEEIKKVLYPREA